MCLHIYYIDCFVGGLSTFQVAFELNCGPAVWFRKFHCVWMSWGSESFLMVSRDSGSLELLSWDLVMEVTPVNHDIPAGEQFSWTVEGFSGGFWRSLLGRWRHLSVWAAPPVRATVESRIPCQLWHVLMISQVRFITINCVPVCFRSAWLHGVGPGLFRVRAWDAAPWSFVTGSHLAWVWVGPGRPADREFTGSLSGILGNFSWSNHSSDSA